MYDRPLTRQHGAPLRLNVPTKVGYKQAKYLTDLKVTNVLEKAGYWCSRRSASASMPKKKNRTVMATEFVTAWSDLATALVPRKSLIPDRVIARIVVIFL